MASEFEFLLSEVTVSNLKKLSTHQSVSAEQRLCELSELADSVLDVVGELFDSGMNLAEIISCISDGFTVPEAEIHDQALDENKQRLFARQSFENVYDRAYFADFFVSRLIERGVKVKESDFLQQGKEGQIFAYVKNQFSDEAFDVFSENISDPRVNYCSSFSEAVKKLVSGAADFCLLPLEERGGVRLPTVSEFIYSNDLKINSVTPVFGYTGNGEIKYAMISKNFIIEDYTKEDDRYLEIRIETDSGMTSTEIGIAAAILGMEIYRINTFTSFNGDCTVGNYSVVIRKTGADFLPFLAYLDLFCPGYTPVGLYKNLE